MTENNSTNEQNIRKYLDMYFKGIPQTDNFVTVFNLMNKIREYADMEFVHDYPFDVMWELTSACNLRCRHCYLQSRNNAYCAENDLNDEEMLEVAKILADYFQINHVTLTGGEPFLRKNIIEIIKILKEVNTSIYIQTNGTLLNDEKIKELANLLNPNMDIIQVSLDGLYSESHNSIRGKDIYSDVISVIQKMIKSGIFVSVNCTMTKINYNEIENLFLMCNEIGVKRFTVTKLKVTTEEQKEFELTNEEIFAVLSKLIDLKQNKNLPIYINLLCFSFIELINDLTVRKMLNEYNSEIKHEKAPKYLNCHRREKISIKPDGKIYLCPDIVSPKALIGDLKTQNIEEIWQTIENHPLYQFREFDKMECKKCKFVYLCKSGCMGKTFLKTKNIYSKSPECPLNI